jgi:hypothetical protein
MRSLFDQYLQPENRLTHALACRLKADSLSAQTCAGLAGDIPRPSSKPRPAGRVRIQRREGWAVPAQVEGPRAASPPGFRAIRTLDRSHARPNGTTSPRSIGRMDARLAVDPQTIRGYVPLARKSAACKLGAWTRPSKTQSSLGKWGGPGSGGHASNGRLGDGRPGRKRL